MTDASHLKELNSRLKDLEYLYEYAACGYLTVSEALQIERINTTALTWLDYSQLGDIQNHSALLLVTPADRQAFEQSVKALCNRSVDVSDRHPLSLHVHLRSRDGTAVPTLLHLSLADQRDQLLPGDDVCRVDIAVFHLGQQESLLDILTITRARLEDAHTQAKHADSRLEVIAQTTPDAIISLNAQQIVTFANPAAEAMFGLDRDKIVGEPVDQLIPEHLRQLHRSHVIKFGRDGQTKRKMAGHQHVHGLRSDGSCFPVDASISRYFADGVAYYTAILRDVSERVSAERTLHNVRRQVQRYAARLRSVREDEQKRISRELHDDIGQRLAALKLDIYNCELELTNDATKSVEKLQAIGRQTSEIIGSVRAMATQLRPKVLDDLGLAPALEIYLADLGKRHSIGCTLNLPDGLDVSERLSTEVFRLVQEATHNIVKHARATHLSVTVQSSDNGVHLAIRDNGQGFIQKEHRSDALGLLGMQERVNSHGGHLNVESTLGEGTLVECFLPLAAG